MVLTRIHIPKLAVLGVVFLAALAVFSAANRSSSSVPATGGDGGVALPSQSTDARIDVLQRGIRARPQDGRGYSALGHAYLQKVRESGDPSLYGQAEQAFRKALERDRRSVTAVTGLGALALARHDFRTALRHGMRARSMAPTVLEPYPVVVDAQVELGLYGDAERTLQRWIDLKPALPSYARVSYFRELMGDLRGAADALRLASSAGASSAENTAYVQTLLGNLEWTRGRIGAARRAYRTALGRFPDYVPASAGIARLDAAGGRPEVAIDRYRAAVDRLPLPEYSIALGELELAIGRRAEAGRDLELVRFQQRLLGRAGVNTDAELAIFEADHGDPERAVRLGRQAYGAAPSVRSADALGWALTAAGRPREGLRYARRALRLGSRDPLFLFHAGQSARAAGRRGEAVRYLERSLTLNPRFSPLHAPRARRALEVLR